MRDVSARTLVKVQYLVVPMGRVSGDASAYLAGFAPGCDVIFAVGDASVRAVSDIAGSFPERHFVVMGGEASGANVAVLNGDGDGLKAAAAGVLRDL
jgi:hypothetical protein